MRSISVEDLRRVFLEELKEHRVLFGIMALFYVIVGGLSLYTGMTVNYFLYSEHFLGIILCVAVWFVYQRAAKLAGKTEKGKFWSTLKQDVVERVNLNQVIGALLLFLFFSSYFSAFQSAKVMIPALNQFSYDQLFAEMDLWLHGGHYPHDLLQPLLGSVPATMILQFGYNVWFPIMLGILAWQMFDRRNPALRQRFMISFALAWFLIGTVGAVLLSSAGPVYFDRVTGLAGPYEEHMAFLYAVNDVSRLFTLDMQELLWEIYDSGSLKSGAGISAMPSLHVSIATLLFLFSRHLHVVATWGFGLFLGAIMLGSVHLGWHYAVDGYLGALLMTSIWWAVGLVFPCEKPARAKARLQTAH